MPGGIGELQRHARHKQPDGQLSLTFEIVYGHAYKPQPKLRLEANSAVSLEDMKAMLKKPRNTGLR